MRFNQILFVDSIPVGQTNTTRRLEEDASVRAQLLQPAPSVVYVRVESSDDFRDLLQTCAEQAHREPYVPLLHVECHGSDLGLEFADGSFSSWDDLKAPITDLNVATRLNLLIIVSACSGMSIASTVQVADRAPFCGFIGPRSTISFGQLEQSFRAFYETLLTTQSSEEAMNSLRASAPDGTFISMRSETMFRMIYEGYLDHQNNEESLRARVAGIRARYREQTGLAPPSADEVIQMWRNREPQFLANCLRSFFMIDLYPENESRFQDVVHAAAGAA